MKMTVLLALCAATAMAGTASRPPLNYTAEIVVVTKGETSRSRIASDGVRIASQNADGKSGSFTDKEKKLKWVYGPSFGCVQMPLTPNGYTSTSREEITGQETIDGHPTQKVKVTSTFSGGGKTSTNVVVEWRATDLNDLVLRRKSLSEDFESHLERVVAGKPDPKLLAFPAPPCKYDEAADTARSEPQQAGGVRSIRFSDASCKQLVPLPLTISIPSEYAIRSGGPQGCLWGTTADLDRVVAARNQFDFESIGRGVFWCRVSNSTDYDPTNGFISEQGPQSQWKPALEAMGAQNVAITSKKVGQIPTCRVTASVNGQRVYMLYLAVPGTDSPAILINYHPAGKGGSADDAVWRQFLESIQWAGK